LKQNFAKNYPKICEYFWRKMPLKHNQKVVKSIKSWGSGRGACACLDTSGVACGSASDKHTPHTCL